MKWVFNNFLPGAAAPRWSLCQAKLVELFAHLGADPAATDSARVLRVVGSLNGKNLAPVKQIYSNDPCSFDDLASALLPRKRLSQIDREAVKTLREKYKSDIDGREKNGESTSRSTSKKQWLGTGQTWCSILCDELLWLVKERSKTGARGSMELCTFMHMTYRLLDGKIENETDFDRQVFELGEIMGANQKQLLGQVKNLFYNYAKGAVVRYFKKSTIIQKLSITEVELLGMPRLGRRIKPVFIDVKRRRVDLPDFHHKARILERAGLSINMIAQQLGVSRVTVKRWLSHSV